MARDPSVVAQVMAQYKHGNLYSGVPAYEHAYKNPDYAPLVDRRDQAIAIALKEAGIERRGAQELRPKSPRVNKWSPEYFRGHSGGGSGGGGGSGF
jgi:hypothetical protein